MECGKLVLLMFTYKLYQRDCLVWTNSRANSTLATKTIKSIVGDKGLFFKRYVMGWGNIKVHDLLYLCRSRYKWRTPLVLPSTPQYINHITYAYQYRFIALFGIVALSPRKKVSSRAAKQQPETFIPSRFNLLTYKSFQTSSRLTHKTPLILYSYCTYKIFLDKFAALTISGHI